MLLEDGIDVYRGLVSDLLVRLGDGPWSKDPNVFGRELKAVLKNANERGLKATLKRVGDGTEWTFSEHWDESNIDGLQEWVRLAFYADYVIGSRTWTLHRLHSFRSIYRTAELNRMRASNRTVAEFAAQCNTKGGRHQHACAYDFGFAYRSNGNHTFIA